ncbi:MAG: hypothetical protein B6244_09250 [Candidatus Cloacimonetes bacterium 4572_55]|nr:MAG: hypothetical protein B6244_09250 [Candidatus Cloacimonetes bacterium 4572_55]
MKKSMLILSIILWITSSAFLAIAEENAEELKKCPDFTLKTLSEDNVKLQSYLEEGCVFIDFWSTWCKPCKKEMKELQKLFDKYHDRGFTVLAVSLDAAKDQSKVKKFTKQYKYSFPILLDPTQEVAKKLGYPGVLPYSLLVDKEGYIHHMQVGFSKGDEKEIEREILLLLDPVKADDVDDKADEADDSDGSEEKDSEKGDSEEETGE